MTRGSHPNGLTSPRGRVRALRLLRVVASSVPCVVLFACGDYVLNPQGEDPGFTGSPSPTAGPAANDGEQASIDSSPGGAGASPVASGPAASGTPGVTPVVSVPGQQPAPGGTPPAPVDPGAAGPDAPPAAGEPTPVNPIPTPPMGTGGAANEGPSEDAGAGGAEQAVFDCPEQAPVDGEECTATGACTYDASTCECVPGEVADTWLCSPIEGTADAGVEGAQQASGTSQAPDAGAP